MNMFKSGYSWHHMLYYSNFSAYTRGICHLAVLLSGSWYYVWRSL